MTSVSRVISFLCTCAGYGSHTHALTDHPVVTPIAVLCRSWALYHPMHLGDRNSHSGLMQIASSHIEKGDVAMGVYQKRI